LPLPPALQGSQPHQQTASEPAPVANATESMPLEEANTASLPPQSKKIKLTKPKKLPPAPSVEAPSLDLPTIDENVSPTTEYGSRKHSRSPSPSKKALKQQRAKGGPPLQSDGAMTKPRRTKSNAVFKTTQNIPVIQRDEDGLPLLPLTAGVHTLHSLGGAAPCQTFHQD
jgi:hypothetical protein